MADAWPYDDEPQAQPTYEDLCAAEGHAYHGDDSGRGRCYCGHTEYPVGGPAHFGGPT